MQDLFLPIQGNNLESNLNLYCGLFIDAEASIKVRLSQKANLECIGPSLQCKIQVTRI